MTEGNNLFEACGVCTAPVKGIHIALINMVVFMGLATVLVIESGVHFDTGVQIEIKKTNTFFM